VKETAAQRQVTQDWPKDGSVVRFQMKLADGTMGPEHTGVVQFVWSAQDAAAVKVKMSIDGHETSRDIIPELGDRLEVI